MNKDLIHKNSKDNWYTPISVIDYINKNIGKITLDPCSTLENATRMEIPNFYDEEQDGLVKDWSGNVVFINPPFSNKNNWIKKCVEEFKKPNTKIILLLPLSLETQIYRDYLLGKCIIHIPNRRISFINGDDNLLKIGSSPMTTALFELTSEINYTYKLFEIPKRGK